MEGTLGVGYSGLHCEVSRGAPRSPSTNACSPLTPSGEIPAALLVQSTVACCTATQQRAHSSLRYTDVQKIISENLIDVTSWMEKNRTFTCSYTNLITSVILKQIFQ